MQIDAPIVKFWLHNEKTHGVNLRLIWEKISLGQKQQYACGPGIWLVVALLAALSNQGTADGEDKAIQ